MTATLTMLAALLAPILIFLVLIRAQRRRRSKSPLDTCSICIVLGSGGHTTEMLRMLKTMPIKKYNRRIYIIAQTDIVSEHKAVALEQSFAAAASDASLSTNPDQPTSQSTNINFEIVRIPRSREVKQSWITTIFTTIKSTIACFHVLRRISPDMILCNGPGTCVPIAVLARIFRFFGFNNTHIVFVESFARVKGLSLSGKILYYIADQFFVQWPQIKEKYPRVIYRGVLV